MKLKELIQQMFRTVVKIEKDDLLHYIFGLLIMEVICVIINVCHHLSYGGCAIATILSVLVVYFKEIYDENHKGHSYEIQDMAYGVAGSITGMLIMMLSI